MHSFSEFPRTVQLHVLKYLDISEQCRFACVSAVCRALKADVTRLTEHITVPSYESFCAGIAALAVDGGLHKLRSVTFDLLDGSEEEIDALFQNCPRLVHVSVNQMVCVCRTCENVCVWNKNNVFINVAACFVSATITTSL